MNKLLILQDLESFITATVVNSSSSWTSQEAYLWDGTRARQQEWFCLSLPTRNCAETSLRGLLNSCQKWWISVVTNFSWIWINRLEIQVALSHRQASVCWMLEKEIEAALADWVANLDSLVEFACVTVVTPTVLRWGESKCTSAQSSDGGDLEHLK